MNDSRRPLTNAEINRLLNTSLAMFVFFIAAKWIVPLYYQPALLIPCIGAIIILYILIPKGRGSLDFKTGMIVGALIMALGRDALYYFTLPSQLGF